MYWIVLLVSALAGILAGILFFGGLWITVRMLRHRSGIYLFPVSFILRSAAAVGVFYILLETGLTAFVIGILSFAATRQVIIRITGNSSPLQEKWNGN